MAPTTPIKSVGLRPILLLTEAHKKALMNSQKVKMAISNPTNNAVFALLNPPKDCTMRYAYGKMDVQAKASLNLNRP